jgi:UDP-N-acetylglucosamine diphosphorylase/glucosamine-1-phosphate N-acetyltransferase
MSRLALFEDAACDQFGSLALLRPVFELLCGQMSNRVRVLRQAQPKEWGAFCRPELAETYREAHPNAHINDEDWLTTGPTLLVNGRWMPAPGAVPQISADDVGVVGDTIVYATLNPDEAIAFRPDAVQESLSQIVRGRRVIPAGGTLVHYPWDLVHHNGEQIIRDYQERARGPKKADIGSQVAVLGQDRDVYVDPSVQIDPFVVIDARNGPVFIDAGARVQAFTRLEGPCYIGPKTQLFRANVREGCSFGPVCRVGGEVEESIILGYSNKYHDGFLGHAYVASWVNLGALTTNSDLKNDYSSVSVPLSGTPIDSGSTKTGCFIGDHTKTALCSLFNTGSSIGVMSMLLPAGELMPKHVPSFSRLWHGRIDELPGGIQSGIDTARTAMSRRDCELTPAMQRLLLRAYEKTAGERRTAIERMAKRASGQTVRS